MGKRDRAGREPKKAKKDARKKPVTQIINTATPVEVIRKERKKRDEEEDD